MKHSWAGIRRISRNAAAINCINYSSALPAMARQKSFPFGIKSKVMPLFQKAGCIVAVLAPALLI